MRAHIHEADGIGEGPDEHHADAEDQAEQLIENHRNKQRKADPSPTSANDAAGFGMTDSPGINPPLSEQKTEPIRCARSAKRAALKHGATFKSGIRWNE